MMRRASHITFLWSALVILDWVDAEARDLFCDFICFLELGRLDRLFSSPLKVLFILLSLCIFISSHLELLLKALSSRIKV